MPISKVAVIGHIIPTPTSWPVPRDPARLSRLLRLYNYTRVCTDDGYLMDHIAYLKKSRGVTDPFSVWEMYLCATLLLTSHLARNNVEVLMVNYIDSDNETAELERIRRFGPDVIVLSTTFVLSGKHLTQAAALLRQSLPDAYIVAGGHHVFTTLMHLDAQKQCEYLQTTGLDAFVNDVQGEQTLLELVRAWPEHPDRVPNLIWKDRNGAVKINPRRTENNDINSTLIDFSEIKPGDIVHIRTARSCSFKCSFCSYPTIAGALALMELENAVDTVRRAKAAGAGALFFVDDTFNVPQERFEALLDRLIQEDLRLPWYSFLRCQFVNEKLVRKMARSGCQGVFLGIESGSDKILKNMNKGSATRFYGPGINWLKDNGIVTVGAFLVGFPGETQSTVAETWEFIERSGLDFYFLQPMYYLHHTPVHNVAEKYGLVGQGLSWSHSTMDAQEACETLDRMFLGIQGPVFVNPDYTLWEVAYLRSKGMDLSAIKNYRGLINRMTASQMTRYATVAAR